ncbi:ATP-dependent RNA helicase [Phlyctema vagabunda]|uniref:ATP-dependent RNA helicase n=1 Tax=Phlyctema vagabunda TaxID=108571 RepID=A0ABR4P7E7_9HELO
MPRPKRTKVAPSAPAPRVRNPAKSPPPVVETFDDIYDVSDREYGPATGAKSKATNLGKNTAKQQSIETPARGRRTRRESHKGLEGPQAGDRGPVASTLNDDKGRSHAPEDVIESSSPEVEVGRRSIAPDRMLSSSIESDLAEDNGLTSVGTKNTSTIGLGNFRRRPRQPSIIGRAAGRARSSSMGLEMGMTPARVGSAYKIDGFRRRAREPSILRTGQKERPTRPEFDSEDDDNYDFGPEDESTPLHLSKTQATSRRASGSAATSTPASNPKKRKLSDIQVPQSSLALPSTEAVEAQATVPATAPIEDEDEELSEPPTEPMLSPPRPDTPERMSDTMAPPLSSSPVPPSYEVAPPVPHNISRGRRILRGRTPPPTTQDSPISSPPSLTHSPNRPAAKRGKTKRQAPPAQPSFSTAQLQALLPRRRRRPASDPFDVPSSEDEVNVMGLASDDDELSHLTVRPTARRAAGARGKTLSRKPAKARPGLKSTARRTYGSKASDKENEAALENEEAEEHDPDDSLAPVRDGSGNEISENSQEMEARLGKELKRAARKFQEVDKWELEFEDVTASSSSPRDAR